MNFGVIGYGYWGPNVVRNLMSLEGAEVRAIAEISPSAQARARKAYPGVKVTPSAMEVITSSETDVVAIVSPVWTHYELSKAALKNGKHVFVEKPFTSTAAQGEELINLAQQKNLKIMVDHTFLFTGAVKKNRPADRRGSAGQPLLLRLNARQSGSVSTRHQRALGPRTARSVHHGPPHQDQPGSESSPPVRGTSTGTKTSHT